MVVDLQASELQDCVSTFVSITSLDILYESLGKFPVTPVARKKKKIF